MKVIGTVRGHYTEQLALIERLQAKTVPLLRESIERRWHFEDRIKTLESFAEKIETGRFKPTNLEDFFACTIVVENSEAIQRAMSAIERHFDIIRRKPRTESETHKSPDSFPFDDLRVYVKLRRDPALPPGDIYDIQFEVQVKTFLQHAWAIATHDLIYKGDSISWPHQRIAYQTRALLENAEVSIANSKKLSKSKSVNKIDPVTKELSKAIDLIKLHWDKSKLPKDLVRLARIITDFCVATRLGLEDIDAALSRETAQGRGTNIENLSPYCVIIQSLIYQDDPKLKEYLTVRNSAQFKVFLPSEIVIPSSYGKITKSSIMSC